MFRWLGDSEYRGDGFKGWLNQSLAPLRARSYGNNGIAQFGIEEKQNLCGFCESNTIPVRFPWLDAEEIRRDFAARVGELSDPWIWPFNS